MKRSDVEEGLLKLVRDSDLGPELLGGTLDVYEASQINEDGQLLVTSPAVLLVPGSQEFGRTDLYGLTSEQDIYYSFLVAATNYRSAAARRQGMPGEIGVNEMLDLLKDAVRGKNPIPAASAGARVFLVKEEPLPELGGMAVYSLTVRVGDYLEQAR